MNATFFVFLLTSLILGINCIVVNLNDGAINGTTEITKEGRLFHKFLKIPYARPPTNKLRFQPPKPARKWTGIKDATQPPPKCVQSSFFGAQLAQGDGQEDCLYLNVYIPHELLNSSGKAPVIVGIHGGAFVLGSANDYAADYFMERDVIFVAINYRLGVLGFLAVNDLFSDEMSNDVMSGNYGLKDQSLALKWVNENIGKFGGDASNVTLLGESAGAVSVHFHMFSPLSKGLFQKAIMQSGYAFSPWSHFPTNYTEEFIFNNVTLRLRLDQITAFKFLNRTNCWNTPQILDCVQKIRAEEFTKPGGLQNFKISPVIESNVTEGLAFLPTEPNTTNYLTRVPWLTGMNSGEGAFFVPGLLRNGSYEAKQMNLNKIEKISHINQYDYTAKKSDMQYITEAVMNYYFGTEDVGLETAHQAVNMITDSLWLYPLKKVVASGLNLQYVYLYDHRGSYSLIDHENLTIDLGVCHADELPLLFRRKGAEAKRSIQDRRVSDTLLKYWINFAISSDPNRHSTDKLWQPVKNKDKSFEYLHIKSDGVAMENNLYQERYDLWKSLPTGWN